MSYCHRSQSRVSTELSLRNVSDLLRPDTVVPVSLHELSLVPEAEAILGTCSFHSDT